VLVADLLSKSNWIILKRFIYDVKLAIFCLREFYFLIKTLTLAQHKVSQLTEGTVEVGEVGSGLLVLV